MKMITTNSGMFVRVNGDTGTNYSQTLISGDGASVVSTNSTNNTQWSMGTARNAQWQFYTLDIFSYVGSKFKTALSTSSIDLNGSGSVIRTVHLWRSTSAISSISLFPNAAFEIAGGSTATLYGIKAA